MRLQNPISQTLIRQWLRLPGDVVFALGALLMAYDFISKVSPFFPKLGSLLKKKNLYETL